MVEFYEFKVWSMFYPSHCSVAGMLFYIRPYYDGNDSAHRRVLNNWRCSINTLRPGQHGWHFPGNFFKCIFVNENMRISIKISLKFIPKGPVTNIPALVQIMAWRRPGDKPLFEPLMVRLSTHMCVTRPQWVKWYSWQQVLLSQDKHLVGTVDFIGRVDGITDVSDLMYRNVCWRVGLG